MTEYWSGEDSMMEMEEWIEGGRTRQGWTRRRENKAGIHQDGERTRQGETKTEGENEGIMR